MSRKLNKNQCIRDKILGINEEYFGGTIHFKNLTEDRLRFLILHKFADMHDCQNNAPSIKDFYNFIKKYPKATAHGYAVAKERDDYRVSIEGLEFNGKVTVDMIIDFVNLCRDADEIKLSKTNLWCWYD